MKIEEEDERQKEWVSDAESVKKGAFNDVVCLRERIAAAGMREVELRSNASAGSSQMVMATDELWQAHDTISTQCKKLARVGQLKSSITSLGDNVALYEASENELKQEHGAAINNSTRLVS